MKTLKTLVSQQLVALSFALLGVLSLAGTALAAPAATTPTLAATTPTPGAHCTTVACVQQFGDAAIALRLAALDKLAGIAQNHKGITDDQRQTILIDLQTNKDGLNALKGKLDAETDIKAARDDVKAIYVQFRIFAVVIPRDAGEIWLFHEQNVIARLLAGNDKITDAIQKARNAGKDVTQLLALQADYNAKLADATAKTNDAQSLLPSLVPANYPSTDGTLKTYRSDLKGAHDDIVDASKDLHQIVQMLKQDLGSGS
jgi:hypothetical protein